MEIAAEIKNYSKWLTTPFIDALIEILIFCGSMKNRIFLTLLLTFLAINALKATDQKELKIPLGLPPIVWPKDNLYTSQKADLGRLLYFDKRLSADGTISCATCHQLQRGFADPLVISEGIHGRKGTRHAPTIVNSAYNVLQFWDGRAKSLEDQCKGPIANIKEMSLNPEIKKAYSECEGRINKIAGYRKLFKEVFGHEKATIDEIAKAIATFERTILSGNSPYDRYINGDKSAMDPEQIQGYKIFQKVGCADCHAGPTFTDGRFMNIGIGMNSPKPDLGRYEVTHQTSDWGAFKTPTLRDVSFTFPYMHNGSIRTLADVIEYYNKGGIPNKNLNPKIRPLHLTKQEKKTLITFLEALNGEGWLHFKPPEKFPE
jgi:cytochrome c peroxidase